MYAKLSAFLIKHKGFNTCINMDDTFQSILLPFCYDALFAYNQGDNSKLGQSSSRGKATVSIKATKYDSGRFFSVLFVIFFFIQFDINRAQITFN